jgi:uncharacterized protein (DUF1330 family)|tara:strand:+ start:230 stop:535 length:306 start_codon:yes stop_codon:yes gene_type:complete
MAAYWIARGNINDPAEYKKYTDPLPDVFSKFGGKILARGGHYQTLEGPEKFARHVIIEFPSLEQARACYESPDYQGPRQFRLNGVGEVEISIVESIDAPAT